VRAAIRRSHSLHRLQSTGRRKAGRERPSSIMRRLAGEGRAAQLAGEGRTRREDGVARRPSGDPRQWTPPPGPGDSVRLEKEGTEVKIWLDCAGVSL
jgi:hypothetical protein